MCPLPPPWTEGQPEIFRLSWLCGFLFQGACRLSSVGKWLIVCFCLCFIQSFLAQLRPAVASEGGLLCFMWNVWKQTIVLGAFPIPSRGDKNMRCE